MARKLRLEFPGAIYHVINRGNYRRGVFETAGAKAAFESTLFEACATHRWLLHGFVIMSNHFHLAVETPEGNLVKGMQWLQSTFANKFNRFRGENGHLFQGRYKSLLVEGGDALGQVVHYLHLNPVRAGIVPVEKLRDYRHSSYWYLWEPKQRPACLTLEAGLIAAGGLPDEKRGWMNYASYLEWQASEGPAGKNKAYASLSKGWALGAKDFKLALLKDHRIAAETRAWDSAGVRELREQRWEAALAEALARVPAAAQVAKKSSPEKVAVAAHLRRTANVSNKWIAERLGMGSGFYVSKHVGLLDRDPGHPARVWFERLQKGKK